MKRIFALLAFLIITTFFLGFASATDMRTVSRKAQADYEAALSEARSRQEQILQNRTALQNAISNMRIRAKELQNRVKSRENELSILAKDEKSLTARKNKNQDRSDEYADTVRQAARDLRAILSRSQFTARQPKHLDMLESIIDLQHFPSIDDINILADLFFEEMNLTGEVERFDGNFIDRDGMKKEGALLTVGPFCAFYRDNKDTGLLKYAEANRKFYALANPLPGHMQRAIKKYMAGKSDSIYVDPSIGPALEHVAHRSTFLGKIKKGGVLIWPILAIGLIAFVLICERLAFLHKVHTNTDRLMGQVNDLATQGNWEQCHKILSKGKDSPVYNVLKAGLGVIDKPRETLENVLNEAILKELPRLERFLPLLNVMAAVSPLLGLLGTVTGMITTFQVISLYGTGNPRLMAGGISEALVTTMLGLAVAIPVMLAHAFLRRRIEHIVGDMEEKALTLSNIICRKNGACEKPDFSPSCAIAAG